MSHPQEIERFRKRLLAITTDGPALRWQRKLQHPPLTNLLSEFSEFAREYFDYVVATYPSGSKTSLSYDLDKAISSLQQKWAVISRACEQREIEEFKSPLDIADAHNHHYYGQIDWFKE